MLQQKATDQQIQDFALQSPYNLIGVMIQGNPLGVYNAIHSMYPGEYRTIPANSVVRNDNTLHDMEKFLTEKYRRIANDSKKAAAMLDGFNRRVTMLDERRTIVWKYINKNLNRY